MRSCQRSFQSPKHFSILGIALSATRFLRHLLVLYTYCLFLKRTRNRRRFDKKRIDRRIFDIGLPGNINNCLFKVDVFVVYATESTRSNRFLLVCDEPYVLL